MESSNIGSPTRVPRKGMKKKNKVQKTIIAPGDLLDFSDLTADPQSGHHLYPITIAVTPCSCCTDFSAVPVTNHDCCQVFDLPEPKLEVQEKRKATL
ncbi:MAG: hypothetical protein U9P07_03455 [Pseudomonadota bacterium]|nr:hypothetical protein [Pseudomonadota bacterium]